MLRLKRNMSHMKRNQSKSRHLGVAIKQYLLERQMKQDELAGIIGVSRQTMSRILNGDTPVTYDRLAVIAAALGVRLSIIVQRAEALAAGEGEAI